MDSREQLLDELAAIELWEAMEPIPADEIAREGHKARQLRRAEILGLSKQVSGTLIFPAELPKRIAKLANGG